MNFFGRGLTFLPTIRLTPSISEYWRLSFWYCPEAFIKPHATNTALIHRNVIPCGFCLRFSGQRQRCRSRLQHDRQQHLQNHVVDAPAADIQAEHSDQCWLYLVSNAAQCWGAAQKQHKSPPVGSPMPWPRPRGEDEAAWRLLGARELRPGWPPRQVLWDCHLHYSRHLRLFGQYQASC